LIHLAKRFQRKIFFRNQPIRNKNCLWWPCLLTDRDKINTLYRRPSIRQYELLPSLGVCRLSSVYFSHFNLLLWKPSAKWTETW
jgi:hypothetical protein